MFCSQVDTNLTPVPLTYHYTLAVPKIELEAILAPEAYLEPSRRSVMELFCENSSAKSW